MNMGLAVHQPNYPGNAETASCEAGAAGFLSYTFGGGLCIENL